MDPVLFISGVSAVMQAVQTWLQFKDQKRAAAAFEERLKSAPGDSRIKAQAVVLKSIVPAPILDALGERARKCWDHYKEVLKGKYLPHEIDEATEAVKACICRELKRISDLNQGVMPDGDLREWWRAYCTTA